MYDDKGAPITVAGCPIGALGRWLVEQTYALQYKALKVKRKMAHPTGFEPVTSAFGGRWFNEYCVAVSIINKHNQAGS